MRAAVRRDHTVRTITIDIQGVPDLDVTQSWHQGTRVIRPFLAMITTEDGQTVSIRVRGGLVMKSGAASDRVSDKAEWWRGDSFGTRIDKAPEWVQQLWREAPAGVKDWRTS